MNEEILFKENEKMIYHVIKTRYNECNSLDKQDLYGYGSLGLLQGIRTYDPKKGEIKSHLYTYILYGISKGMREGSSVVGDKKTKQSTYFSNNRPFTYYEYIDGKEHIEGEDYVNGLLFREKMIDTTMDKTLMIRELRRCISRLAPIKKQVIVNSLRGVKCVDMGSKQDERYFQRVKREAMKDLKGMLEGKDITSVDIKRIGERKDKKYKNLDKEIKAQAKLNNMKVDVFCKEVLGVSKACVEKWWKGTSIPKAKTKLQVAARLNKDIDYLFEK